MGMHRWVWSTLLVMAAVVALFGFWRVRSPQHTLDAQVSAALSRSGFGHVSSTLSGCTVTLSGQVNGEEDRVLAERSAAEVPNVCRVVNMVTIAAAGPEARGDLRINTVGETVSISGVVPSQLVEAVIVAAAAERWGPENVRKNIVIQHELDVSGWPVSFVALLDAVYGRRQNLEVGVGKARIELFGSVVSALERARVHGAIDAALPGMPIVDNISVRAPASDAERLQLRLDNFFQSRNVSFLDEDIRLTPAGREMLDDVVHILEGSEARIEIAGHTDSNNSSAYNLDISQRRAESVRGYLVSKRIDRKRFETVGYGESRPIARNDTEENRARNRRIEFHVLSGP